MPVQSAPLRRGVTALIVALAQVSLLLGTVPPRVALAATGDVVTVAGGVGSGVATGLSQSPNSVAVDGSLLFIADASWRVVRRLDLNTGNEILVAGTGFFEHGGDGGPATEASFSSVNGMAIDSAGNLYVVDQNAARIRRIDAITGTITTFAGTGNPGSSGNGGPATDADISPVDVAIDADDDVYFSEPQANQVRMVDADTGEVSLVAGTGAFGFDGDGGPAIDAELAIPHGLAVDGSGNLFIADMANHRVRRVDAVTGDIDTYAGNGTAGSDFPLGDGGPATDAQVWIPHGLAIGPDEDLYIVDHGNHRIRRVDVGSGIINTVAGSTGNGSPPFDEGDGGPATSAELYVPWDVTVRANGDFYVADGGANNVRAIDASTGVISQIAGNDTAKFGGDGEPGEGAQFAYPMSVSFGPAGDMYVADGNEYRIRRVSSSNVTSTFAGNGTFTHSGDGGPATSAGMGGVAAVLADAVGNVFIADSRSRVRRVATDGTISTYAGVDTVGYSGDGGPATAAQLNTPVALAIGPDGDLFVTDLSNHVIRRIDVGSGEITTVAGDGTAGFGGDDGPATDAQLNNPRGIAVDAAGNLYIADSVNFRIRRVDAGTGIITTIAGNGTSGASGDDGPAADAGLAFPLALTFDVAGNLYISDDVRVRRIAAGTGTITRIAGSDYGYGGDGGPATAARFGGIYGLMIGPDGDLYIADNDNYRVRRLDLEPEPPGTTADLRLTKVSSENIVAPGDSFTWTATVDNLGPDPALAVTLEDTIPAGVSLGAVTPSQGSCADSPTVMCDLGTIAAGAAATVTFDATVSSPGNPTNTASVSSDTSDPVLANNDASDAVMVPEPGTPWAWGSNEYGQLGDGSAFWRAQPIAIQGLPPLADVVYGDSHGLALDEAGGVWSWGANWSGEVGDGTTTQRPSPVELTSLPAIQALDGGANHSIALDAGGNVWSWGANWSGELGTGSTEQHVSPVQLTGLPPFVAVSAGWSHTLALDDTGHVWVWGNNSSGQLGDGSTTSSSSPMQIPGLPPIAAISAGAAHSLAVDETGTLWAWGANWYGQLGDGTTTQRTSPVQVIGLSQVTQISAGYSFTAAIDASGALWTWGGNWSGNLGDGTTTHRSSPAVVAGLSDLISVRSGYAHMAALDDSGQVWVWGNNSSGQLGDGTTTQRLAPVALGAPLDVEAIAVGGYQSAAVDEAGVLWTWGGNWFGQLGDGSAFSRWVPHQPLNPPEAIEISAGYYHSVALDASGSLWAWGANWHGQLGNGSTSNTFTPTELEGLPEIVSVSAGYSHTLALDIDGNVWAWGANWYGALGDGTTTNRTVPVEIAGLPAIMAVSAGTYHSLALDVDGNVWAWGSNYAGQIGDGTLIDRPSPVAVGGLVDVTSISAGGHSTAIDASGQAWAWGSNWSGQLGDGTTTDSPVPVQITGLADVVSIAAGGGHTLALDISGNVWAWGANWSGQLGDGSSTERHVPFLVPGLRDIAVVSADYGSAAIGANGDTWMWGSNWSGQLGDGTNWSRSGPVRVAGLRGGMAVDVGSLHTVAIADSPLGALPIDEVSAPVGAGGSLSTDDEADGATAEDPIETTVTSPNAGTIEITETPAVSFVSNGYSFAGHSVVIEAPNATAADPLVITFSLDAAQMPSWWSPATLWLMRDGVVVQPCIHATEANPDPCLETSFINSQGDIEVTVRTSHASEWTFALSAPTADPGGPYAVAEGADLQLDGNRSGGAEPLSFSWTASVALQDPSTATPTITGLDDGSIDIGLQVADANGSVASRQGTVVTYNVSPVVGTIQLNPTSATTGTPINASASFSDAGSHDTHSGSWNWGDGHSSPATINQGSGTGTASATHTYTASGSYTVQLTLTDDDGGVTTVSRVVQVTDATLIVAIDIKPGTTDNKIKVGTGTVPVAILSTATFNATTQVNRTTIRFGRTGTENSIERNKKGVPSCSNSDVNADGRQDLVCKFNVAATGFQIGDTEGILRGQTTAGIAIEGRGPVRIVR